MNHDDLERILTTVAEQRADADGLTRSLANLGDALADGIRASEFDTLDMETVGAALVIAATSLTPYLDRDVSPAMVLRTLVLGGENLIRTARARVIEPRADEGSHLDAPWMHEEFVLTWHQLNGKPPVEVPFDHHWVFPAESCGEFRLSTRETPPPPADRSTWDGAKLRTGWGEVSSSGDAGAEVQLSDNGMPATIDAGGA